MPVPVLEATGRMWSAEEGVDVPMPTRPVFVMLKKLLMVATEKSVAGELVPMPMFPLERTVKILDDVAMVRRAVCEAAVVVAMSTVPERVDVDVTER